MLGYVDEAGKLKVYVSLSRRAFVGLLRCCSTLCFSWPFFSVRFLVQELHSIAVLQFR